MIYGLVAVLALILIACLGSIFTGLDVVLVAVLYLGLATFIFGFVYRVLRWARVPVPFHIPTTCGQQKSLPWIKHDRLDSPTSTFWVIVRVALEVLVFRSLWKNERVELKHGSKLVYGPKRYLWLGGLLFHWSLAIILFRHLRFFTQPVLPGIAAVQGLDGLFQIGTPSLYFTDVLVLIVLTYLFVRRAFSAQLRLISLPSDYFALFLLIAIALSGILMRHFFKTDLEMVKELTMGLVSFRPVLLPTVGAFFHIHLFLASVLLAYFPFSKLMHAGGVVLSPTRNLVNDSRMRRHVNPWDQPVKVHTYEEYEDEFREAMVAAGVPVEKTVTHGS